MSDPWLAIDVATAPAQRAREIRRAWELFVGGGWDDGEPSRTADAQAGVVRGPIEASWRRSAAAGVDPAGVRIAPVVVDCDQAAARWEVHPLAPAARLIRTCLAASADESGHLLVVADADGVLLWVEGSPRLRLRAADSMNFAEGVLWSEPAAGTNAIGTALAARHEVQVFATEHFNERVQAWTCAAAPVRDPDSGRVLGVVNLTGAMSTVHPHSMALATATARAVEAQLRCELLDSDARLMGRFGDLLAHGPGPRALVSRSGRVIGERPGDWLGSARLRPPPGGGPVVLDDGRVALAEPLGFDDAYLLSADGAGRRQADRRAVRLRLLGCDGEALVAGRAVALRRRHAEILAVLCANREGLSGDRLAAEVYGDASRGGAVRVEISRLRGLLPGAIEPDGYRAAAGLASDLAEIQALLHQGSLRQAAERCRGPLLPGSRAPGVVRERDALERWLRQAVMCAGDPDALWAWLQTPSGGRDVAAWRRLLAGLPFADPRRSLAAARLAQLRAGDPSGPGDRGGGAGAGASL